MKGQVNGSIRWIRKRFWNFREFETVFISHNTTLKAEYNQKTDYNRQSSLHCSFYKKAKRDNFMMTLKFPFWPVLLT